MLPLPQSYYQIMRALVNSSRFADEEAARNRLYLREWSYNNPKTTGDMDKDAAAAAKSLQSCLTLCNHIDGSPPGSSVPGILQARTLEWVAISFSNAWKWKVKVKSPSRVRLLATPWTAAHQAPLSMGFSRQEYWSGVPLPSSAATQDIKQSLAPRQINIDFALKVYLSQFLLPNTLYFVFFKINK